MFFASESSLQPKLDRSSYDHVTILFNQEAQYLAAFAGRGPRGCGRKSMMVSFSWGKKCWSSVTHLTYQKSWWQPAVQGLKKIYCTSIYNEVVWWVSANWYQLMNERSVREWTVTLPRRRMQRCKSDVSWTFHTANVRTQSIFHQQVKASQISDPVTQPQWNQRQPLAL